MPPLRLRFSLLNVLLLTTIVATAAGLYVSKQRNDYLAARSEVLAKENRDFRTSLGLFEIEDSQRIHAISVPTASKDQKGFRVYLPPGRKYRLCYRANEIPRQGIPIPTDTRLLESGKHLIAITIEQRINRLAAEVTPIVEVVTSHSLGDELTLGTGTLWWTIKFDSNWLCNDRGETHYQFNGIRRKLELSDVEQALVLYRARAIQITVTSRDADGKPNQWQLGTNKQECDGLMVWIEPVVPTESR